MHANIILRSMLKFSWRSLSCRFIWKIDLIVEINILPLNLFGKVKALEMLSD